MTWTVSETESGVQVAPEHDTTVHTDGLDCICGPHVEWVDPDTHMTYPNGPLVVHASLDGREQTEES